MSGRVTGYHYVVGKDGRRHRVYGDDMHKKKKSYTSVPRAIRGSGGYYDSGFVKFMRKAVPKGTFRGIGKAIGSAYGVPEAGATAGKGLASILGFGAYTVNKNSLMSGKIDEGMSPPAMHSTNSDVRVRHREYVTDIISSGTANTFKNESFSINPGRTDLFPWLSAVAANFQEYKIDGMVLEFKSVTGTAIASSTNTTMGGVIMATNYNVLDQPFQNKIQMENCQYTTSAMTFQSFCHPIECDMKQNPLSTLYVRTGSPPSGSDQRLYDLGSFQIASWGVQGTSVVLGELWITYEVTLKKPLGYVLAGDAVLTDLFAVFPTSGAALAGATPSSKNSIGGTIQGGAQYNFPPNYQDGLYQITYQSTSASPVTLDWQGITPTNCEFLAIFPNSLETIMVSPPTTASSTTFQATGVLWITGLNANIQFATANVLPAQYGYFIVTQFNAEIDISPTALSLPEPEEEESTPQPPQAQLLKLTEKKEEPIPTRLNVADMSAKELRVFQDLLVKAMAEARVSEKADPISKP